MKAEGRKVSFPLVAKILFSFSLGASLAMAAESPSWAYVYSGSNASSYAHQYSCNGLNCRNAAYLSMAADCTNFVSQAIRSGGMPMISVGATSQQWFYRTDWYGGFDGSLSWTSVNRLYSQLQASGRWAENQYPSMSQKYSGAKAGDIYMLDLGRGENFSHMMLATESGNFTDYFDSGYDISYSEITGGSGSRMAQHSPDRDFAPWNFAYWAESNLAIRAQMETVIVKLNSAG